MKPADDGARDPVAGEGKGSRVCVAWREVGGLSRWRGRCEPGAGGLGLDYYYSSPLASCLASTASGGRGRGGKGEGGRGGRRQRGVEDG